MIQLYIYINICIHSFQDSLHIQVFTEYWLYFPVLHSRSLLIIYFIYSSMYVSQSPNLCPLLNEMAGQQFPSVDNTLNLLFIMRFLWLDSCQRGLFLLLSEMVSSQIPFLSPSTKSIKRLPNRYIKTFISRISTLAEIQCPRQKAQRSYEPLEDRLTLSHSLQSHPEGASGARRVPKRSKQAWNWSQKNRISLALALLITVQLWANVSKLQ